MELLQNLKSGYAIVAFSDWNRKFTKAKAFRYAYDLQDAIYNAQSLTRCDGCLYCVYDAKNQKILY